MTDDEVIDGLREGGPRQIRVMCPNDDFIASITLSVRQGGLTMQWGLTGKDLRRRVSQRGGVLSAEVHVSPGSNTVLKCPRGKCCYRGYFHQHELALELARAALAGRAEYHLPA